MHFGYAGLIDARKIKASSNGPEQVLLFDAGVNGTAYESFCGVSVGVVDPAGAFQRDIL